MQTDFLVCKIIKVHFASLNARKWNMAYDCNMCGGWMANNEIHYCPLDRLSDIDEIVKAILSDEDRLDAFDALVKIKTILGKPARTVVLDKPEE